MPKKVTQVEKELRLFYESLKGIPITTSHWCYIKNKIKISAQPLDERSLIGYHLTCATSGKAVVTQLMVEDEMLEVITTYCKRVQRLTGKQLHDFSKDLCLKYTSKKVFSHEQIKRLFEKAFKMSNANKKIKLNKIVQFHSRFSYNNIYTIKTLQTFFTLFCAWCRPHLKITQPMLIAR